MEETLHLEVTDQPEQASLQEMPQPGRYEVRGLPGGEEAFILRNENGSWQLMRPDADGAPAPWGAEHSTPEVALTDLQQDVHRRSGAAEAQQTHEEG